MMHVRIGKQASRGIPLEMPGRISFLAVSFMGTLLSISLAQSSDARLTHQEAAKRLTDAGIAVHSSGKCSDPKIGSCTSLEQIREQAIVGLVLFQADFDAYMKRTSCKRGPDRERLKPTGLVVTGGTEVGHTSGAMSHSQGYKIDLRLEQCLDLFIKSFDNAGVRASDGSQQYKNARGDLFALEKKKAHWDVVFK